jgi:hypothetical protein
MMNLNPKQAARERAQRIREARRAFTLTHFAGQTFPWWIQQHGSAPSHFVDAYTTRAAAVQALSALRAAAVRIQAAQTVCCGAQVNDAPARPWCGNCGRDLEPWGPEAARAAAVRA